MPGSIIPLRIPKELIERPQWLLYRIEIRDGKATKVPFGCMGYRASVTNVDQWSGFEFTLKTASQPGFCDGIGFVFTADDPYCGIDLDHVWQSDADEGARWALSILERFSDTYSEQSPSGAGVKIWCRAKPPRCGRWPIAAGAIEIYDHARFFTVTGRSAGIQVVTDHQADIEALVANLDQNRHSPSPRMVPEVIPQGQRHNALVSLAGTMYRRGMTVEAIEAALLVTDQTQCDPPHGPEHIHKIVASMAKWER
jgi:putative DNA primase/helicase